MKLLFICSENRLRSPTAEAVFAEYDGIETLSAGTNNEADVPISGELIEWADAIFVMEETHKISLSQKFQAELKGKRLRVLGIPDIYEYMQPELVQRLKDLLPRYIRL